MKSKQRRPEWWPRNEAEVALSVARYHKKYRVALLTFAAIFVILMATPIVLTFCLAIGRGVGGDPRFGLVLFCSYGVVYIISKPLSELAESLTAQVYQAPFGEENERLFLEDFQVSVFYEHLGRVMRGE